jgi:hypothetical protein
VKWIEFADASAVDLHLEKETYLLDVAGRFLFDCLDCTGSMPLVVMDYATRCPPIVIW